MSYRDGFAALNLEFSPKIPRTEYSAAHCHWELVKRATGMELDLSIPENRPAATRAFLKAWDYGMMWSVLVHRDYLERAGAAVTDMGHAVFSGEDYNDKTSRPYLSPEDVYAVDPARQFARFSSGILAAEFEADYRRCIAAFGDDLVNMSGTYISLFSGLIDLFGWEALLLAMGDDPERFLRVVDSYAEWMEQFFDGFARSNVPVMMVHDDLCWTSGPVTSPEWYRRHIFPHLKRFIRKVREAGKLIYFTSDGLIEAFYSDIAGLGVNAVVMEPCNDIFRFTETYGDRVGFVGGMDCRTLTYGSKEEIRSCMERLMALGRRYPGFMLAVGNHLSVDVPVDRALYYNELYESMAYR